MNERVTISHLQESTKKNKVNKNKIMNLDRSNKMKMSRMSSSMEMKSKTNKMKNRKMIKVLKCNNRWSMMMKRKVKSSNSNTWMKRGIRFLLS